MDPTKPTTSEKAQLNSNIANLADLHEDDETAFKEADLLTFHADVFAKELDELITRSEEIERGIGAEEGAATGGSPMHHFNYGHPRILEDAYKLIILQANLHDNGTLNKRVNYMVFTLNKMLVRLFGTKDVLFESEDEEAEAFNRVARLSEEAGVSSEENVDGGDGASGQGSDCMQDKEVAGSSKVELIHAGPRVRYTHNISIFSDVTDIDAEHGVQSDSTEEEELQICDRQQGTHEKLFYGNVRFYSFLRLHELLCQRLEMFYQLSLEMNKENDSRAVTESAVASGVEPCREKGDGGGPGGETAGASTSASGGSTTGSTLYNPTYSKFIQLIESLLYCHTTTAKYEAELNSLFCSCFEAKYGYNLGTLISRLVSEFQDLIGDGSGIVDMNLNDFYRYEKSMKEEGSSFSLKLYRLLARNRDYNEFVRVQEEQGEEDMGKQWRWILQVSIVKVGENAEIIAGAELLLNETYVRKMEAPLDDQDEDENSDEDHDEDDQEEDVAIEADEGDDEFEELDDDDEYEDVEDSEESEEEDDDDELLAPAA